MENNNKKRRRNRRMRTRNNTNKVIGFIPKLTTTVLVEQPKTFEEFCYDLASKFKNPLAKDALDLGTKLYENGWQIFGRTLQATGIGIEIIQPR